MDEERRALYTPVEQAVEALCRAAGFEPEQVMYFELSPGSMRLTVHETLPPELNEHGGLTTRVIEIPLRWGR